MIVLYFISSGIFAENIFKACNAYQTDGPKVDPLGRI